MVASDFTEAIYQRLLHNIASPGWKTTREVVSLLPPLSPPRVNFNITFRNGVTFLHKDLQCKKAAIHN